MSNKIITTKDKKFDPDNDENTNIGLLNILNDIKTEFSKEAQGKYGSEFHNNYDHDDQGILDMGGDQKYNAKFIKDMYLSDTDDHSKIPEELKYLDHMHLSETELGAGSIQAILKDDSSPNKIKSIITDRNKLRKILVATLSGYKTIFNFNFGKQECKRNITFGKDFGKQSCKDITGVSGDTPFIIDVPQKVTDDISELYKNDLVSSYAGRLVLTSWIYKNFKKTHLLRHQIIFPKENKVKNEITFKVIYKAPALRTYEVFSNLKNYKKIMAKDYGEYKTFKEDEKRLQERTIYIKFVGKNPMMSSDNPKQNAYEKQMGMVTGGKTRKRKSKATKKKNRPVKRKFTRKHRGGAFTNAQIDVEAGILVDFYHIHKFDDTNASKDVIDLSKKLKDANIYLKQKNILQRFYGNIYQAASKQKKELNDELVDKTGYFQENNEMIQVSTSKSGVRDPKLNIKFKKAMFIDPIIWLKQQPKSNEKPQWIDKILKAFKLSPDLKSEYNVNLGKIEKYLTSKDGENPLEIKGNASINRMKEQITDAILKGKELNNIDNKIYQEEKKEKSIFSLFSNPNHYNNVHGVNTIASININQPKSTSSNIKLLIQEYPQGSGTVPAQSDSKPSETVTEPSSTEAPTDLPKPDDTPEVKSDLRADAPEFIPQVTKEKKED